MSFTDDFLFAGPDMTGAPTSPHARMSFLMDGEYDLSPPLISPPSSSSPAAVNSEAYNYLAFNEIEPAAEDSPAAGSSKPQAAHPTGSPPPTSPLAPAPISTDVVDNVESFLDMSVGRMATALELTPAQQAFQAEMDAWEASGFITSADPLAAPEASAPVFDAGDLGDMGIDQFDLSLWSAPVDDWWQQQAWEQQGWEQQAWQPWQQPQQPPVIQQQPLPAFLPPSAAAAPALVFAASASAPANPAPATTTTTNTNTTTAASAARIRKNRGASANGKIGGSARGHVQALKHHKSRCTMASSPLDAHGCRDACMLRTQAAETWAVRCAERWMISAGPRKGEVWCGLWEHLWGGDMERLSDGMPFRMRDRQVRQKK